MKQSVTQNATTARKQIATLLEEMGDEAIPALCICIKRAQLRLGVESGESVELINQLRCQAPVEAYRPLGWIVEDQLIAMQTVSSGQAARGTKAHIEYLWACFQLFLAAKEVGDDMREAHREEASKHIARALTHLPEKVTLAEAYRRQVMQLSAFRRGAPDGARLRTSLLAER